MASQFPPKKNTAFTLYFSLYKSDGTIVANPGAITKKVSIDGAAVADIAAAVTEEDTTYGQCSVVLAAGEMNGDAIWIYITDDTAGTVPFTATLYTAAQTLDEVKTETAALVSALATVDGIVDDIKLATVTDAAGDNIAADIIALKAETVSILEDTGTTLPALIADLPTVAEFTARTAPTTAGAGAEFTAAALALAPGGGTGLTAQQTRDALKLAPSAGAPAAGSVDAELDAILEDTGTTIPATIYDHDQRLVTTEANLSSAIEVVARAAYHSARGGFARDRWCVVGWDNRDAPGPTILTISGTPLLAGQGFQLFIESFDGITRPSWNITYAGGAWVVENFSAGIVEYGDSVLGIEPNGDNSAGTSAFTITVSGAPYGNGVITIPALTAAQQTSYYIDSRGNLAAYGGGNLAGAESDLTLISTESAPGAIEAAALAAALAGGGAPEASFTTEEAE